MPDKSNKHERNKKMKTEKNAVETVVEIQKRNKDVHKIANPK
ncbi:hypothetical protein [Clostridium caldaquaticum]|nr:hypothetical protein [Clostridium caldaquaticum]